MSIPFNCAVIRVDEDAGNVIETHGAPGELNVSIESMSDFWALQETPFFIGKWACSSAVRAGHS